MSPGEKTGSTPFGVTTIRSPGQPVELLEIAPRPLRDGEDAGRLARRARHDALEDGEILLPHQRRVALEREIVDRDDRRAGAPQRHRVLRVDERRRRRAAAAAAAPRPCRSSCTRRSSSIGSIPSGTSSGRRVTAAIRMPRLGASGASSRSRFRTYVSSPVRRRPSDVGVDHDQRAHRASPIASPLASPPTLATDCTRSGRPAGRLMRAPARAPPARPPRAPT